MNTNKPPEGVINIKDMRRFIKKMRIMDKSIILIKPDTPLATKENVANMIDAMQAMGIRGMVMVGDEDALREVDVKKMMELGWYRLSELKRMRGH
jgi:hypothetical protein